MSESTAIARRPSLDVIAFEPSNLDEAYRVAQMIVGSGLAPKSVKTPEDAMVIMMTGRELGISTMKALRSIHVIEGKPSMSADLMVGLVKASPACEYFMLVKSTAEIAIYRTKRRGEPEPVEMSFTFAEAQRAGVTGKAVWKSYPAAMLRARCSSGLTRAVYADILMGIYDPEELGGEPDVERGPRLVAVLTPDDGTDTVLTPEMMPDPAPSPRGPVEVPAPRQTPRAEVSTPMRDGGPAAHSAPAPTVTPRTRADDQARVEKDQLRGRVKTAAGALGSPAWPGLCAALDIGDPGRPWNAGTERVTLLVEAAALVSRAVGAMAELGATRARGVLIDYDCEAALDAVWTLATPADLSILATVTDALEGTVEALHDDNDNDQAPLDFGGEGDAA